VAATTPATPAAACKLKVTFDYLVRTTEPGLAASAQEIGNVDFIDCTPTLQDFAQTAGQAQGECTTIARASRNPDGVSCGSGAGGRLRVRGQDRVHLSLQGAGNDDLLLAWHADRRPARRRHERRSRAT